MHLRDAGKRHEFVATGVFFEISQFEGLNGLFSLLKKVLKVIWLGFEFNVFLGFSFVNFFLKFSGGALPQIIENSRDFTGAANNKIFSGRIFSLFDER